MEKKAGKFKKFLIFLSVSVILGLIIAGYAYYTYNKEISTRYKGYKGSKIIHIKKGSSVNRISEELFKEKIIKSTFIFKLCYKVSFKDRHLKSGKFRFSKELSVEEVLQKLDYGKTVLNKITVKEGLTISEIAVIIEKKVNISSEDFVRAASDTSLIKDFDSEADDLEGYLFPDTYMVEDNISAKDLCSLMVNKFSEKVSMGLRIRLKIMGMSMREIITLASLIEKETSSREERFKISSVFHNRLKIGMALGCDPTVIYAVKKEGVWRGKLGWKELKFDSKYNTRIYRGLPPGPICNPGFSSIEAALYPENTKYLYFVAKDSRSHYFSKTLKEHNKAVRKYILKK